MTVGRGPERNLRQDLMSWLLRLLQQAMGNLAASQPEGPDGQPPTGVGMSPDDPGFRQRCEEAIKKALDGKE